MNVIDLDRPTALPTPHHRRHNFHPRLLATLLVGVVLGASATYGWSARNEAAARERQVAVFVFAQAGQPEDQLPAGSVVQDGRVATVTLTRHVTFVNAGPVPINVRDLSAAEPGVSVRGVDKQRWIQPGATAQADVDVQVDCRHGLPLTQLPVTLLVQTVDEVEREAGEGIDLGPWSDQAEAECAR
jgi:hypothetical protein